MRKILWTVLTTILLIQLSGIFSFLWFVSENLTIDISHAQSPSSPIFTVYRDAAWWEDITNVAQALSWDTLVSQDAEIPIHSGNTSFDLSAWGHYLMMYSVPVRSTSWGNRSEIQSRIRVNGLDSPYTYGSSYIRRANNDFEWYNEGAAILNVAPWDDVQVRIQKTDTNTASMERTPGRSWVNILKLDDDWDFARIRPSARQAITPTWSKVNLATADEIDNSNFSLSGNDLTLWSAWKYLVTYSVWAITTGTDRTNNEIRLTLNGTEIDATRSTTYIRAQNGSFTGIASYVGIIESSSANQVLNLEIMRESTLQGTTNDTVVSKTGLTIAKLPDTADYLRIGETVWGQDVSTNVNTPLTFDTTLEQGISLQHTSANSSDINILGAGDYMLFHSVYNRRTGTWNGPRENPYLEWQVWGVTLDYGTSWSYNRNANDGDGITNSSHSSAWLIIPQMSSGDTIRLTETNEASAGPTAYAWLRMGIQWVNLQSLFVWNGYLSQPSYRWRDDSSDFDQNTWWLAAENTGISNIKKNETVRLRMKVENTSWFLYTDASQFELQWAETSQTCSSISSWESISAPNDSWEMLDSSHISPDGENSATQLLSNSAWNTHIQSEWYHNSLGQTLLSPPSSFANNSQKEYEFSLRATAYAQNNTLYCFRLFDTQANDELGINNFARLETGASPVILDDIWWEAGKVASPIDGWWTTINYTWWPYTSPVIVGRTNTYNDGNEALVFEARNITSTSAQVRLCDSHSWNATWCQPHASETIWYIVVDAAQTASIDGVEAGTFSADESFDTTGWLITTNYSETFSTVPYVFSSIQSSNGDTPIVTRIRSSSISNFQWWICQQITTDDCNPTHPTETFGWIAVDPTMNPFFKDMDIGTGLSEGNSWIWSTANFSTNFTSIPVAISQTVTNLWGQDAQIDEIQNVTTSWMQFRSCELDTDDDCDTHAVDTIRWLAIEEGVFANEYLLDKTHYRWYENNAANTPVTPLAQENTVLSSLPSSRQLRLRMLLQNSKSFLPSSVLSLKLQYAPGISCDTASPWTNVWASGGTQDWLHYDNPWLADGATLTNSLLFGGWHNLQSYNESLPTVTNPNPIPAWEWGERDFSLIKNSSATWDQYCFRAVTQNDDEIEYSSYALIHTNDSVDPVIQNYSPSDGFLHPIGNLLLSYTISDDNSGINTSNYDLAIEKWDGSSWGPDISSQYESLDEFSNTQASFNIQGLSYGKYRASFEIYDNAGNSASVTHEFYVDEVEFNISTSEVDIWDIDDIWTVFTSTDTLTVTVKTVWAWFSVLMSQQAQMTKVPDTLPNWDGTRWFWYEAAPFWSVNNIGTGATIASETQNINTNWEKNTYSYDLKYSLLLDMLDPYAPGNYDALLDFDIDFNY